MEQSVWDLLITGGVLIAIILTVWARVSGMTIPELIKQIKDIVSDKSEDMIDETPSVIWKE